MNQVPRRPRNVFRLPEPVNVNDPTWQGRFYQLIIDALNHIDECLDEYKEQVKEQRVESSAWMAATAAGDKDLEQRILTHLQEHHLIDENAAARMSVWKKQWKVAKEAGKFLTSGAVVAVVWALIQLAGG